MFKEKGEELFRALHSLLDASVVTNLNVRDLEAEAKAESSSPQGASTSASASAKGKAKDPNPDWTQVPFNPVSITPLSTRPRFSQIVGSSSEAPGLFRLVKSQLKSFHWRSAQPVNHSSAVLAAWAAMNAPGGQDQGQGQGAPQGPQDGGGKWQYGWQWRRAGRE
jgi:hypothetical protein